MLMLAGPVKKTNPRPVKRKVKVFSTTKRDKYMRVLSTDDWAALSGARTLLKPLYEFQLAMEGQRYVTLSAVPFQVHALRAHLTTMSKDTNSPVQDTAALMLEDFDSRWQQDAWPRAVLIAVALDPRTKMMRCFSKEHKVSSDSSHLTCFESLSCAITVSTRLLPVKLKPVRHSVLTGESLGACRARDDCHPQAEHKRTDTDCEGDGA